VFRGDLQGRGFLAYLVVVQVAIDALPFGVFFDGFAQGDRGVLGVGLVVLNQYLGLAEEAKKAAGMAQEPFAAAEAQPIETAQHAEDKGAETL
jgi:hypothetical protein